MNSVLTDLLTNLGVDSVDNMDLGEAYEIDMSETAFLDLHVEKVRPGRLSIAHYYEQNGDLCSDPDVVFKPVDGRFVPVELTQQTAFGEKYRTDPNGLAGVNQLLERWGTNLRNQGHVEAAKDVDGQLGA